MANAKSAPNLEEKLRAKNISDIVLHLLEPLNLPTAGSNSVASRQVFNIIFGIGTPNFHNQFKRDDCENDIDKIRHDIRCRRGEKGTKTVLLIVVIGISSDSFIAR